MVACLLSTPSGLAASLGTTDIQAGIGQMIPAPVASSVGIVFEEFHRLPAIRASDFE